MVKRKPSAKNPVKHSAKEERKTKNTHQSGDKGLGIERLKILNMFPSANKNNGRFGGGDSTEGTWGKVEWGEE